MVLRRRSVTREVTTCICGNRYCLVIVYMVIYMHDDCTVEICHAGMNGAKDESYF